MLGKVMELQFKSSCHCCINIVGDFELEALAINNKVNEKEKINILTKLQGKFGHASFVDKLKWFLRSTGTDSLESSIY